MRAQLVAAARPVLVLTVLTGIAYTVLVTGVAPVEREGEVIGAELIGSTSAGDAWFHGRPRTADAGDRAPVTNEELLVAIEERAATYREDNDLGDDVAVPIDAVTSSVPGVAPRISVANARLQAARVAQARDLGVDEVFDLVEEHATPRTVSHLAEKEVDVLQLNLAVDELGRSGAG